MAHRAHKRRVHEDLLLFFLCFFFFFPSRALFGARNERINHWPERRRRRRWQHAIAHDAFYRAHISIIYTPRQRRALIAQRKRTQFLCFNFVWIARAAAAAARVHTARYSSSATLLWLCIIERMLRFVWVYAAQRHTATHSDAERETVRKGVSLEPVLLLTLHGQ